MPPPDSELGPVSRIDAIATQWSLVRDAHTNGNPSSANAARQALVLRYARAIRRYVGAIVRDASDADEVAQEVIVRLMKGDFGGADPNRGRFRDLLKVAVRNMTHTHLAKANRRKPAAVDLDHLAVSEEIDPAWDTEWRQVVIDQAWKSLREQERSNPRPPLYTLLQLRVEKPEATSEELAEILSSTLKSPVRADACRQWLRRARLRFAAAIVDELQTGIADPTPEKVNEELANLGLLELVKDYLKE